MFHLFRVFATVPPPVQQVTTLSRVRGNYCCLSIERYFLLLLLFSTILEKTVVWVSMEQEEDTHGYVLTRVLIKVIHCALHATLLRDFWTGVKIV